MNDKKHIIIIGLVWPEPASSAAGVRMLQLILLFKKWNWTVTCCSAANSTPYQVSLTKLVDEVVEIKLNDPSFDDWIKLKNPDYVLFDRYISEEQFGWRVAESCPTAIRILDTEDLHCLRYARGEALKKKKVFAEHDLLTNDYSKREIAAIYRCDLSLMVSTYEMEVLQRIFRIPSLLMHYIPLFYDAEKVMALHKPFEERNHSMFIGNFLHEPNLDAANWLCQELWPAVRNEFPFAELHIYGAYMPKRIEQLNSSKGGVIVKGRAGDVLHTMQNYRINLAPLRFGAGIKGKLLDALLTGTPTITTRIGSEAMGDETYWSKLIAEDKITFVDLFKRLYTDKDEWNTAVDQGKKILLNHFNKEQFEPQFFKRLIEIKVGIEAHRQQNFIGYMLQHHLLQSTRYLSKWIELKNQINN
jgi:O-antigen biosynthesis protein